MGRVTGEPVVVFAVPIKANGQMVGVLAGSVRLRSHPMLAGMARRAAMANNISGETLIYVTDAQSNLVWHPDSAKAGLPVGAEPLLAGPMAAWKQAGSPVDPNARASDDPNHILAYAGLPAAGWLLWRLEDRADVLAPLVEARQQALKAGAALTLCLTGLLLALLWRLLAPLRQLRARAERLFEPGLAADQGWPLAVGEVGELGSVLKRVLVDKQASDERSARMTQQLRSVLEAAPLAILLTRNGVFELASPEACRVLGRTEEAFAGLPGRAVYASNQDYALLGPRVGLAFSRKETFVQEVEFLRGDGSTFWGRLSGRPVDWQVSAAGTIWTVTDISAERAEREGLLWSANHDALTGLANRLAMTRHLDTLLAHRQTSTPAALLMLDLDRFKPINDQHGHAAGDAMLRAVAQALTGCVRGGDLAVRLGGDEFAVLLPLCAADAARRVAESICQAVARLAVPWEGQSLGVGVSVGLAMLNPDLATAADWLAAADGACYAAKAAGRGTVRMAGAPEEAAALRLVVVNT
jgi:diguanylate cyclase (GGDEF)-like protein/PAS domain S-box-containing protein